MTTKVIKMSDHRETQAEGADTSRIEGGANATRESLVQSQRDRVEDVLDFAEHDESIKQLVIDYCIGSDIFSKTDVTKDESGEFQITLKEYGRTLPYAQAMELIYERLTLDLDEMRHKDSSGH